MKLPGDLTQIIDRNDPLYTFNKVFDHIDPTKYFAERKVYKRGRPEYDRTTLLKIVLFAFMENGYSSVRQIERFCHTDIRFLWLLNEQKAPSFMTIENFMKNELQENIEGLVADMNAYIFEEENVDLNHIYLDGTKLEANANKYTWVWKKSCIRNRNKQFAVVSQILEKMNALTSMYNRTAYETRQEYTIEYLEFVLRTFLDAAGITKADFVHGSGKRKTLDQRLYEELESCMKKLKRYSQHIRICGDKRNSYSKTDMDATFMRCKNDHMRNGQLLPSYNVQFITCDEYIASVGIFHFASDMDCFQPMMEQFYKQYGFYPEYPIADAGYGSFNNYLYCEEHGMKKYMKFTMYDKLNNDRRYRDNPFRATNFPVNEHGNLVCPGGKEFHFLRSAPVRGNQYGRTEEYYQCESCEGCYCREQCHKSTKNRIIRINQELTTFHEEVLQNLNSIHGALLRMNRSIQAEGAFGEVKWNKGYDRIRRRGSKSVKFELLLISAGFNLHKFHLKKQRTSAAA